MIWRALILILVISTVQAQENCPVIPHPVVYENHNERLMLGGDILINWGTIPVNIRNYFTEELEGVHGFQLKSVDKDALISFQKMKSTLHMDAYSIDVDDNVLIKYASDQSALYALNSLLQLFQEQNKDRFITKCSITDYPNFEWRGLHLDVSRHFFTVDEVKRYIDLMALYKFNKFHWHLTDDQGWRIEIKKYPKLTEVGGYRDSTLIGHYSDSPRRYDHIRYGGFYTKEDIKDIVAYAADRYITVVPEIEMPGHSRAALAAYPEYSCTGKQQPVPGLWGVFDDIYCSKPATIQFMKDILTEVVELFPSEYIHIGGDEAPKTRWEECENCQKVMHDHGLKNEHELQSYFIRQMDDFLTEKGKKLIGWDEILEGGLSPNAAVMSWRGEQGGVEAANQKHEVVMSPTTYCYFDYYQSNSGLEPVAIGGYLPMEKVYQFNPIPKGIEENSELYILGGQANLWTEYIPTIEHLEYMAYPRALALSQCLWSESKPPYENFVQSFIHYHQEYLNLHQVNFSKAIHYPKMIIERAEEGVNVHFSGADPQVNYDVQIGSQYLRGDEYYHGAQSGNNEESAYIGRTINNDVIYYKLKVSNPVLGDSLEFNLRSTNSLGMPIELITPPHPKYNNNGSLNLVDGIYGGMPWKGSEWLGFRVPDIEMIVDLENDTSLSEIRIGLMDQPGSWIYLPESVEIYKSSDRNNWTKFVDASVPQNMYDGMFVSHAAELTSVHYVKIVLHAMKEIPKGKEGAGTIPWTFIDEIEIVGP